MILGVEKLPESHEFCPGDDERRCKFCGGYPFDLQHWTI